MLAKMDIGADEVARPNLAAETQAGLPLQTTAGGQTMYADYPVEAYPAGFSSYRGMGFMGSFCEQNAPAATYLWRDYCETKDHHAKLFDGLVHGWKHGGCKPVRVPAAAGSGSGWKPNPEATWKKPWKKTPASDEPVTQVSSNDAMAFCEWLTALECGDLSPLSRDPCRNLSSCIAERVARVF
jgi:Sulfatase-modifying factor enzyme 1